MSDKPLMGRPVGATRPPGFVVFDEDEEKPKVKDTRGKKMAKSDKASSKKATKKISRMVFFDCWMDDENKTVKQVAAAASKKAGRSPQVSEQAMRARAKSFRDNGVELPYKEDEIGEYSFFAKKLAKLNE